MGELSKVPQLESVRVRIVNLGLQGFMQCGFRQHLPQAHQKASVQERDHHQDEEEWTQPWYFISEPPGLGTAPACAAADEPSSTEEGRWEACHSLMEMLGKKLARHSGSPLWSRHSGGRGKQWIWP